MNPNRYVSDDKAYEKDRLLSRAWGYSYFGMFKEAVGECEKLVRLDPKDVSSYIELGRYCEDSGDIDRAVECYKYVMKKFPKNFQAYLNLGYVFEKFKKRNDMAIVCYEKALELNPRDEWALNNIGVILQKEGRRKEALSYYERAYEVSKLTGEPNSSILHNLAWAHYRCKNYERAMVLYQKLLDDEEYVNASAYYDCACVNYKIGAYNRALKLFEKAMLLCPDNRYYRWSCQIAGKKGELKP